VFVDVRDDNSGLTVNRIEAPADNPPFATTG